MEHKSWLGKYEKFEVSSSLAGGQFQKFLSELTRMLGNYKNSLKNKSKLPLFQLEKKLHNNSI